MTVALPRRRATATLLAAAASAALPFGAWGQTFPARPITFVVPFGAGSATDLLARALGQAVGQEAQQPVVVDNRAGANGMLAAQSVARAPADGYTVLIATNTTQSANPHLFKKLTYDPVKDFVPLTGLGKGGQVLVVRAESPHRSVAELVAHARKNPGKLSFGGGSGSSRMAVELFKQMTQTDILHVPYKSNPNAVTDLIGGQIDLMITDTATGVPHVKGGKLRALGVSTSRRLALLPEVPTIAEAGVKGYEFTYWFAAYAPAHTPPAVVARLQELLSNATRSAGARGFYESTGGDAWTTTSDELARFQAAETQKWGQIIRAAGVEPE